MIQNALIIDKTIEQLPGIAKTGKKDIFKIKHTKKKKIPFSESRKSVKTNFSTPSYAEITQAVPMKI